MSREASSNASEGNSGCNGTNADGSVNNEANETNSDDSSSESGSANVPSLIEHFAARDTAERVQATKQQPRFAKEADNTSSTKQKLVRKLVKENQLPSGPDEYDDARDLAQSNIVERGVSRAVDDFNDRLAEQVRGRRRDDSQTDEEEVRDPTSPKVSPVAPITSVIQSAFDRMRPRRKSPEVATITIGSNVTTSVLGSSVYSQRQNSPILSASAKQRSSLLDATKEQFNSSMQAFAAPGSMLIQTVGLPQSKARAPKVQNPPSSHEVSEDSSDEVVDSDGQGLDEDELEAESRASAEESVSVEPDDEYIDESEKKVMEEAKVAEMIRRAEEAYSMPSDDGKRRAQQAMKGNYTRDSTTELVQKMNVSIEKISQQLQDLRKALQSTTYRHDSRNQISDTTIQEAPSDSYAPDHLTLTVTKEDFTHLHIIGQFNLGFILATRNNTDLFIIDQHASDEKINFERLQATTLMQNQRLVRPRQLELTAVDEEIILENQDILLRNGFVVDIDESGDVPVGQRVSLLSLPMSKETTFAPSDLQELIAMLADAPAHTSLKSIPRPTKIRKLLAMRACRSSIMIGKVMTRHMMQRLVARMGEIDKPWNCPHGRPTMRHVCGLEGVARWAEEEGEDGEERVDWNGWVEGALGMEDGADGDAEV